MSENKIIINGIDVSKWTDEEIRYNFEKHSPKAIRQIAFDLYKQLARKEQILDEIEGVADSNLCDDDRDVCPDDCLCDWKAVKDIINKAKEK